MSFFCYGQCWGGLTAASLLQLGKAGNVLTLRLLYTAGADLDTGDYDMRTALHLAAAEGKVEAVRALVDELGAAKNPTDRWGKTPLQEAQANQHAEIVAILS